jgi:type III pantothenate kinase
MILAINIGNTNTHLGLFSDDKLIRDEYVTTDELEYSGKRLEHLLKRQTITAAGISSVVPEKDVFLRKYLKDNLEIIPYFISGKSMLPIKLKVLNPGSLGSDRICNAVAGYNLFKRKNNVIIVDCGTAITYDVVLKNGNYEGGSIAPGLLTLAKSLNEYTSKLPLLTKPDFKINANPVGRHTFDALNSGIVNAFIDSVNGMISKIVRYYKLDFKVIITGGDAEFLLPELKFKSVLRKDCVLDGINFIMKETG